MEKSVFYKNVEILRILFCTILVYFHLLPNLLKTLSEPVAFKAYQTLAQNCHDSGNIVECFFILSGFFLFKTFEKKFKNGAREDEVKEEFFKDFVLKKIARLWPVLAFVTVISAFLKFFFTSSTSFYTYFLNLFFLQCVGITTDFRGITWFVSPLFWGLILYCYILLNFKHKNLIIALLTYFSLVCCVSASNVYGDFIRGNFLYFLSGGFLRALFGLGIGYFVGLLYSKFDIEAFKNKFSFIIISLIEIFGVCFLLKHFLYSPPVREKVVYLIIFSIVLFLFLIKKGVLSKFLENKILSEAGKYSYSIYMTQQLSFWFLTLTLWKNEAFILNIPICILVSVAVSLIIGVLTYYFIERPMFKFLEKKFKRQ